MSLLKIYRLITFVKCTLCGAFFRSATPVEQGYSSHYGGALLRIRKTWPKYSDVLSELDYITQTYWHGYSHQSENGKILTKLLRRIKDSTQRRVSLLTKVSRRGFCVYASLFHVMENSHSHMFWRRTLSKKANSTARKLYNLDEQRCKKAVQFIQTLDFNG